MKMPILVGVLFVLIMLSACSQNTTVDSADIKERKNLMKQWRSANDIVRGMVDNPANFDQALLQEQTQFLADTAPTMWTYFADPNAKGNTSDTLWKDKAGFDNAADEFNQAVDRLNQNAAVATSAADIESSLFNVAQNCGSCHKAYKK